MDSLQGAVLLAGRMNTTNAHSALPAAPVVPQTAPAQARVRGSLARLLHRAADAVAPSAAFAGDRSTLAAGKGSGQTRWDASRCRPSPTTSA